MIDPESIPGWMSGGELAWLRENMRGLAVEIGTYQGRSAAAMVNVDKLVCVDTWNTDLKNGTFCGEADYQAFRSNRLQMPHFDVIEWHRADSEEAAQQFLDGSIDSLFIDGSHEYAHVRRDIDAWLPKVKTGGLVAGHDYGNQDWPGVEQAVRESFGNSIAIAGMIWSTRKQ